MADRWTEDLATLLTLTRRSTTLDELLARVLDALQNVVPYDMAAVLELVGDQLEVRCARGPLVNDAVRTHRVAVNNACIREAITSKQARIQTVDDHAHGGDPYHDIIDLPDGHSCMVVPLIADDRTMGVMTFDRAVPEPYPQDVAPIATIYGQIVALSMAVAARLEAKNRRLDARARILEDEARGLGGAALQISRAQDPAMQRLSAQAQQVAQTDAPVLILGETGTGKEVLARAIHQWSPRSAAPFVKLNCAALPENLIESELFGHRRGAFSGATDDRPGRFSVADGGTLLLDEIGDMPLSAQAKLLRVLQEGVFEPVGSDEAVSVDVRIMAATHVDLESAIEAGRFREDLYYRLNLFPLMLPPLRERMVDVVAIAEGFLHHHAHKTGRGPWTLSEGAKASLQGHDWPGNVRELVNVLERATILNPNGPLDIDLGRSRRRSVAPQPEATLPEDWLTLAEMEKRYIERVLKRTQGKIYGDGGAAELLGMKPTTLRSRMDRLGVDRSKSS